MKSYGLSHHLLNNYASLSAWISTHLVNLSVNIAFSAEVSSYIIGSVFFLPLAHIIGPKITSTAYKKRLVADANVCRDLIIDAAICAVWMLGGISINRYDRPLWFIATIRRGWNPEPAHSLLFSKSNKRATRLNVPFRLMNCYQQYYMPSQHIYCGRVWNLIEACNVQFSD